MTKEEAKKFGLHLLQGIMERNESYPVYANNVKQAIDALSESGSSEKPMNQDELEEEIETYFDSNFGIPWDGCHPIGVFELDSMARHFAEWGAERQKEQDDKLVDIIYQQGIEKGKDDMKEQMMKEAVTADVMLTLHDKTGDISLHTGYLPKELGIKYGDKVKLIIIKEDAK